MLPLGQPQWLALNEWAKHPLNESGAETNMGDGDNRWGRWLRGGDPLEQGLPTKNDDAIYLINRTARFAGKPHSHIESGLPQFIDCLADGTNYRKNAD
jgi:hypothetical protein